MNLAMTIALIKKYSNVDFADTDEVRLNVLADNWIEVVDDEAHNGLFKYVANHNLGSRNISIKAYDNGEEFQLADTQILDENNVTVYISERKLCRLVITAIEDEEGDIEGISTKPFDIENGSLA